MHHNPVMARKRTKTDTATPVEGAQPPRPGRMVRIRQKLVESLERVIDRRASDLTEEVNRAVREMLERENLWPPESKD